LAPRGHQQPPRAVEGQGPDVLVARVVERLRLSPGVDRVHLPVGRGPRVDPAVGAHGQRLDLELGGVEERRGPAVLHAEDLAVVPGAGVDRALAVPGQAPDERRVRVGQAAGDRGQAHAALGVHGKPLGVAGQEVLRALELPELRLRGAGGRGRGHGRRRHQRGQAQACAAFPGTAAAGPRHRWTVRVSSRDPVTAYSVGRSKSQTAAVRRGMTLPASSDPPRTESTDGGRACRYSPRTIAPSSARSSRAYTWLLRRRPLMARMSWSRSLGTKGWRISRCSIAVRAAASATSSEYVPAGALAGTDTGMVSTWVSPL